jgi:hypothetical protein
MKAFEVEETLRIDSATGPAKRGKRKVGARVVDGFIEREDQLRAADRWLERGNQQAMIAARETAGYGTGSVAAKTIGYEPLARFRRGEVAANFASKLNFGFAGH